MLCSLRGTYSVLSNVKTSFGFKGLTPSLAYVSVVSYHEQLAVTKVPVSNCKYHAMTTYKRTVCKAPCILNLGTQLHAPAPRKVPLRLVYSIWDVSQSRAVAKREFPAPAEDRIPCACSVASPVHCKVGDSLAERV
jgi:hypothetical protein